MEYCRNPPKQTIGIGIQILQRGPVQGRFPCIVCVRHDFNPKYPEVLGSRALYSKIALAQELSALVLPNEAFHPTVVP